MVKSANKIFEKKRLDTYNASWEFFLFLKKNPLCRSLNAINTTLISRVHNEGDWAFGILYLPILITIRLIFFSGRGGNPQQEG